MFEEVLEAFQFDFFRLEGVGGVLILSQMIRKKKLPGPSAHVARFREASRSHRFALRAWAQTSAQTARGHTSKLSGHMSGLRAIGCAQVQESFCSDWVLCGQCRSPFLCCKGMGGLDG